MLTLTDHAQIALARFIAGSDEPLKGLRIRVMNGGCSGLQYAMSLEAAPHEDDLVVECGKAELYVDAHSIALLKGTTIDFVDSVDGSGFTFQNPNAAERCSCGKSFGT